MAFYERKPTFLLARIQWKGDSLHYVWNLEKHTAYLTHPAKKAVIHPITPLSSLHKYTQLLLGK